MIIFRLEDDKDIREIVKFALEILSDLTVFVHDCEKVAIAIVEQIKPDMLPLNVMMPEKTGPETLIELRKLKDSEYI
ncbi:MAG: CheY-like chemotaxis protein [Octadecabacter sp.]|jgi:CheY-like chemotaxis protein